MEPIIELSLIDASNHLKIPCEQRLLKHNYLMYTVFTDKNEMPFNFKFYKKSQQRVLAEIKYNDKTYSILIDRPYTELDTLATDGCRLMMFGSNRPVNCPETTFNSMSSQIKIVLYTEAIPDDGLLLENHQDEVDCVYGRFGTGEKTTRKFKNVDFVKDLQNEFTITIVCKTKIENIKYNINP